MVYEYTHTPLEEHVDCFCSSYRKLQEGKLRYKGNDVLYFVGATSEVYSCCGYSSGISYLMVPGYLVRWQEKTNDAGLLTSEVAPIRDEDEQREIRAILREKHGITQVEFW